jgi:RimJ/RimL family protein N-acetyltransferase
MGRGAALCAPARFGPDAGLKVVRLAYCGLDEADELMAFIRDHWSADHALSRSRRLLDWQHRDEQAGRYNLLLARAESGGIVGMIGFIPSSRYDPGLAAERETIWLTTWRALEGHGAGLGLLLLREIERRLKPKWIGTVGLNHQIRAIYAAMGYRTGEMNRSYRLNRRLREHRLVLGADAAPSPSPGAGATELRRLAAADFAAAVSGLDAREQEPAKTPEQFRNRYLEHPFYDYQIHLAEDGGRRALIVLRACSHDRAVALRWVDFLGDETLLAGIGPAVDALLEAQQAEYVDYYHVGDLPALAEAGFARLDPEGPLVLPGYFEPFERSNVRILYALKGGGPEFSLGKGDCDQDRPNLVAEDR